MEIAPVSFKLFMVLLNALVLKFGNIWVGSHFHWKCFTSILASDMLDPG